MPLRAAGTNSFAGNSLFIFLTRFFPSLANLVVMIWYSRHLSQQAYGNYQHFWIQLNVIYPLACFGVHVLIVTYPPAFLKGLLAHIRVRHYIGYTVWGAVLAGIFAYLQQPIGVSFVVPFFYLLVFSVSMIGEAVLIIYRRYAGLIAVNVLYAAAFCAVHLFALRAGLSLQALFIFLLVIAALRLAIYAVTVASCMKQQEELVAEGTDTGKTRDLWLHLGIYDVSQIMFNYIDKFIISLVLTAQLSAIYYNASQTIPFLPLLLSAAGSAVLILSATKDGHNNMISLVNHSGRMLSCIVFPIFFFLFAFRQEFIVRVFTERYLPAVPIFGASILVLPVKAYSFTTVLQKMHKGAVINIGAMADLVLACGLMYPMYLWIGLPGVALSFVISTYLQAAFYLLYTARLLHVSPLKLIPYGNWLIKLIVFAFLFIGIHYAANRYFTGGIPLILGGVAMIIVIIASLLIDIKRSGNGNVRT